MTTFLAVYNMVSSDFWNTTVTSLDEFMKSDDFVSVGTFQANDVEDAYRILNIDHPENIVSYVRELGINDLSGAKYPALHTSMSVGDVLVEYTNKGKVYHMCDRSGWIILK